MTSPPLSPQPFAPTARPRKPSALGVVFGIVLTTLGLGVAVVVDIWTEQRLDIVVELALIHDPGDGPVQLTAGQGVGFWVYSDIASYDYWACSVTGPDGTQTQLDRSTGNLPQISGQYGMFTMAASYTPTTDGAYSLECHGRRADMPETVRVMPLSVYDHWQNLNHNVTSVAGVSVTVGAVLLIFTLVRRSRWRRQYGPPPMAPVAYGALVMYPPPGTPAYGPPGGYQPGAPRP